MPDYDYERGLCSAPEEPTRSIAPLCGSDHDQLQVGNAEMQDRLRAHRARDEHDGEGTEGIGAAAVGGEAYAAVLELASLYQMEQAGPTPRRWSRT